MKFILFLCLLSLLCYLKVSKFLFFTALPQTDTEVSASCMGVYSLFNLEGQVEDGTSIP